jgi:2-oxoacid:acceptor oxidoreductase delta subunit (pyruvate/2-ketoisovalerate family)
LPPAANAQADPAEGSYLSPQQAQAEAARCLQTHACQGCQVCLLICPDQAITQDPVSGLPSIDLAYCKGCGLCAHFCPKGAISMELEVGE